MPGAYTHITLVNTARETRRLEAIPDFPTEGIMALLDYFKFCELGAVSPDYPYLSIGDGDAARWADAMHYASTGDMIRAGAARLRTMDNKARSKGLAWLLGFSAHVAADVALHPVVNLKVGPYVENKTAHRVCEMNQDVYLFQRLNIGDIGLADHLKSGIGRCGAPKAPDRLDHDVRTLWRHMLETAYPDEFMANTPAIDIWHRCFNLVLGDIADEGRWLPPFARHVAAGCGLVYPLRDEIDLDYIEHLATPESTMHLDELFQRAQKNIEWIWTRVARGVLKDDDAGLDQIGDWNLDTGRDVDVRLVFWEENT